MVRNDDYRESERAVSVSANDFADVWVLIGVARERLGNTHELRVGKITLKTYGGETAVV